MATIQPERLRGTALAQVLGDEAREGIEVVRWANIGPGDTCAAAVAPPFGDRTVEIFGELDGGTIAMKGWTLGPPLPLTDPQGNPIEKTGEAQETLVEITHFIQPLVSGLGPAALATVAVSARKVF
ncbi:MAG: hypothetical protein RLZZ127_59 [Planctomycetota bacterium]|jgi:hypothetical protein